MKIRVQTVFAALLTFAFLPSALLCADEPAAPKRAKWKSNFEIKQEPLAGNVSSTCRRQFGAGLYDAAVNKTFVCWSGPGMSVWINDYDHGTGKWSAGREVCHLEYTTQWAYHDYPVMRLAPDGRLVIYFCEHGNKLFQVKAPAAHSLDGDWAKTLASDDHTTYPMPVVADGVIYVFYSKNEDRNWPHRSYRYIKSADSGATWSAPATVIDSEKKEPMKFDEVYSFGVCLNPDDGRVGITWTMAGSKAHNAASRDLYFAFFNTRTGNMENAGRRDLGPSVLFDEFPACLVVKTQGNPDDPNRALRYPITRPQPSYIGKTGAPVVAFGTYKAGAGDMTCFMRWDGAAWKVQSTLPAGNSFYDLEKIGPSEFRMFVRKDSKKMLVLRSTDGGRTWKESAAAPIAFAAKFNRVPEIQFIEDGRPPVIGILGTAYSDKKKPGGYNYDGIFNIHAVMEK
jgi:hypothetical protein